MDVKWIKIDTTVFDNRKIRQIETLKDGDAMIVIWFKLLCLAGNTNNDGFIYFTPEIPYTDEMLATYFNRPLEIVRSALKVFEQFEMVEIIEDIIKVSSWEKYQNVDGMSRIREQNRIRKQKQREREKAKLESMSRDTSRNVTQQNKSKDTDIDKKEKKTKEKKVKHKYGEYKNVLLTDEELDKLKNEYSDWQERIENLSSYVASTGKSYKSHYATIRVWARKDKGKNTKQTQEETTNYDWSDLTDRKAKTSNNSADYF